jgi:hypothetical protein
MQSFKMLRPATQFSVSMIFFILVFSGCGGGGGNASGPVVSTLHFPFLSAYQASTASGMSKAFTVSGDCSGSGTFIAAPATMLATFETVSAYSAGATFSWTASNCSSSTLTYTAYYTTSYLPLGDSQTSLYGVFAATPTIPALVSVGDTGIIGTETLYLNSSKGTQTGRYDYTYIIEADTATSAIVNIVRKIYNSGGTLTTTEQHRYRITETGPLTYASIVITHPSSSSILVFTYH